MLLSSAAELDGAFVSLVRKKVGAAIVQPIFAVDPQDSAKLVQLTLTHRLPVVCGLRPYAEPGGLITYASDFTDLPRRAAVHVDKILKGAKPGDLPVEQPTKFELIVNLKNPARAQTDDPAVGSAARGPGHRVARATNAARS